MTVKLLHHTPLPIAVKAIRKCWASEGKSDSYNTNDNIGPNDRALIYRVGNKNKHASTLEHISYNFNVDGISRACLQEFARHRIASLSVKSSRYTLKELKDERPFSPGIKAPRGVFDEATRERADKYVVFTGDIFVDDKIIHTLEGLRQTIRAGISNDVAKYCMPEAYKTSLVWTINARSLQNFLNLRTNKAALKEIRDLANTVFDSLPTEHKYLHEEFIHDTKEDT